MGEILAWVSLAVAVLAAAIAVWQAQLSKQQLELARDTTAAADRTLNEIRDLARSNESTVSDIKSAIDERITRILDLRLEAEKQELVTKMRRDEEGAAMAKSALKGLGGMFLQAVKEAESKPRPEARPTSSEE